MTLPSTDAVREAIAVARRGPRGQTLDTLVVASEAWLSARAAVTDEMVEAGAAAIDAIIQGTGVANIMTGDQLARAVLTAASPPASGGSAPTKDEADLLRTALVYYCNARHTIVTTELAQSTLAKIEAMLSASPTPPVSGAVDGGEPIEGLSLKIAKDGTWLNFQSKEPKLFASLRLESLADRNGHIIGNAIRQWLNENCSTTKTLALTTSPSPDTFRAGAESMREACASEADDAALAYIKADREYPHETMADFAKCIRALPLPTPEGSKP